MLEDRFCEARHRSSLDIQSHRSGRFRGCVLKVDLRHSIAFGCIIMAFRSSTRLLHSGKAAYLDRFASIGVFEHESLLRDMYMYSVNVSYAMRHVSRYDLLLALCLYQRLLNESLLSWVFLTHPCQRRTP